VQESPRAYFTLPFESIQLENLLLRLDPGRSGLRRVVADPQVRASLELGSKLFEAVFSEDIRLVWWRSQDAACAEGKGLRLSTAPHRRASDCRPSWELLYDRRRNAYIAQSERTPLVRYLEVTQPPAPFKVGGALRILVVVSSPTDLPEIDVEGSGGGSTTPSRPCWERGPYNWTGSPSRRCQPYQSGYATTTSTSFTLSATATSTRHAGRNRVLL
jgi:hypothetical protein